jgi:hypothetical protein
MENILFAVCSTRDVDEILGSKYYFHFCRVLQVTPNIRQGAE